MRKWIIVSALVLLLALGYAAWPFVGLHQLGQALHSADAAEVERRVNLNAIRRSIVRQLLDEELRGSEIEQELQEEIGDFATRFLANAAEEALNEAATEVLTSDILRELIAEGRFSPAGAEGEPVAAPQESGAGFAIPENPLRRLQSWGFSTPIAVKLVLGEDGRQDDWIGLTLRRSGLTWVLRDVRLSKAMVERIRPTVRALIEQARS